MSRPRRVLRFQAPDRGTLDRLASDPLPGGLEESGSRLDFFRDVYFDTPAADLKAKGASVRLRLHKDGAATLVLDVLEQRSEDAAPRRRSSEARLDDVDPATLFRGDAEPARELRALIDPDRLEKVLELETLRRERTATCREEGDVRFCFDQVTVRRGELTGDLFEVEVLAPSKGCPPLEGLAEELRARGLRPALAETVGRAREIIEDLEIGELEQTVRSAREVAVVAHRNGAIALLASGGDLVIPHAAGVGPRAARTALRRAFGHGRARIRLLGSSAGAPGRPSLQVWLAEDIGEEERNGGSITWVPIEDALERAGSPGLRNPRTLAALHVVARSGLSTWAISSWRSRGPEADGAATIEPLELVLQRLEAADGTVEPSPKEVPPELMLNMELSRLAFDERILVFAEDPRTPLLERVRFLGMFGERRDDFFMSRVGRFKRMLARGEESRTMDGLTPAEQLDVIAIRARQIMRRAYSLLRQHLLPELESKGITIERWQALSEADRAYIRDTYGERLEALVTPLATDPTHPFPHVRNLRPALAAIVRFPEGQSEQFIAVELPGDLPRFMPLQGGRRFVPLEDVVEASLAELYAGLEVMRAHTFRVTRSAKIDLEAEPLDMLQRVEEEITRRPFQEVVRLEVEKSMPPEMRHNLLRELQFEAEDQPSTLGEEDVYTVDRLVDLAALKELARIEIPELRFGTFERRVALDPQRGVFDLIRERERLVHFPHDSFESSVERFLFEAAEDPDVVGVKVTVYRTSKHSAVLEALRRARDNGKDAVAMVELKASFDEQRNIGWARGLESAGIRVVFSPPKFKVHAKIALAVRREGEGLRRYAYIGTGNLNATTATTYVDLGLFTADPTITQEVNAVFNLLTGYSAASEFRMLLVAPLNMRRRFLQLIEREIEHVREGRGGRIRAQLNGLADRRLVGALYRASEAGVEIDLMVREICALRPGVSGVSENIRVTSLLGRFLQHARIFHFANGGEDEYFLGSADWRPRNLVERVEVATPVRDPEHRRQLSRILDETLGHPEAWQLRGDGSYVRGAELITGAVHNVGVG